ncbi:MAG TPA: FCD domain-containing protein, partial [Mycobacterium sp.]|nr:FCD domain-containing protein [Mycobacterium sp.]
RKGYQVAPLTIRAVDDLMDFWEIIGPEVARRGIESATPEQRQAMLDLVTAWEEMVKQPKWEHSSSMAVNDMATRMFSDLAVATGNSYLAAVYDRLASELTRVFMLILDAESTDYHSLYLKYDIRQPIEQRDGELLAKVIQQFIRDSHDRVLHILARWPSVMAAEVEPLRPKT